MFDEKLLEKQTNYRKRYVANLRNKLILYDNDLNIEERKEKQLCKVCFYIKDNIISGQAFTDKICENCGTKMTFATTDVDTLCMECAKKYNACKHCGAKID